MTDRWPSSRSPRPMSRCWSRRRVEYPVQINGKVRAHVVVPADADPTTVERAALSDAKVVGLLDGVTPKRVVVVPERLVNIVL